MAAFELKLWELLCYCVMFIVGLAGNLTVCLVVLKSGPSFRRFRFVPFNVYLMSLAIVDLTLAVVCLPIYVMSTSSFPHPTGRKGNIFCKIITGYAIPFWLGGVSIYMLVIISFERYTAVCKPFQAMSRRTSKKTAFFIAAAWLIGFTRQLPTFIGIHFSASKATYGNYCRYDWADTATSAVIYGCVFAVQYLVPAGIFIANFYRIRKSLNEFDRTLKRSLANDRQRVKIIQSKKKTVRIVFVVSLAFFVCWTPNNIVYFLYQFEGLQNIHWTSDSYQATILLGFFNSCINPFLYAFQSREFRAHCSKVLREMFDCTGNRRRQSRSSSSTVLTNSARSKVNHKLLQPTSPQIQ